MLLRQGKTIASLEREGGEIDPREEAEVFTSWVRGHVEGERLIAIVAAKSVTMDQIAPLVETGRQLGIPIDVRLESDA